MKYFMQIDPTEYLQQPKMQKVGNNCDQSANNSDTSFTANEVHDAFGEFYDSIEISDKRDNIEICYEITSNDVIGVIDELIKKNHNEISKKINKIKTDYYCVYSGGIKIIDDIIKCNEENVSMCAKISA